MHKWIVVAAAFAAYGCGGQGQSGDQFAGTSSLDRTPARGARSTGPTPASVRPPALSLDAQQAVAGASALGWRLLAATSAQDGQPEQPVLAPISLGLAIGMAATGATGETYRQMATALGLEKLSETTLREAYANVLAHLLAPQQNGPQVAIANSIWVAEGVRLKQEFFEGSRTGFRAGAEVLDLQAPATPARINRWIAENTDGKIQDLIDQIAPDARLLLVNAIYFRGDWATPFDPEATQPAPFRVRGGEPQPRPLMRRTGDFAYGEFEGVQVVRLPYAGGRFAMRLVLPVAPDGLPRFIAAIDAAKWTTWGALRTRAGEVAIPKWTTRARFELADALSSLGMARAFTNQAEFGGIAEEPLKIGRVVHEAVVEVDERGAEAAGATTVEMRPTSVAPEPVKPFQFVADRPFLWAIEDTLSGAVLFVGVVTDPVAVSSPQSETQTP